MNPIQILVADDDQEIRRIEVRAMKSQGYQITECGNGLEAMRLISTIPFDLILLDIDMEGMDGFEILQKMRDNGNQTPVLIVTGKEEEYNEVFGFSLGADDYIIKPFRPSALSARVKAMLTRYNRLKLQTDMITAGPFRMVCENYTFFKNNTELALTPKERQLLYFFMRNIGHVFSREQLYESVWKENYVDDNTIMVTIRNLRQKIEDDPKKPVYLLTVYGLGYKFVCG